MKKAVKKPSCLKTYVLQQLVVDRQVMIEQLLHITYNPNDTTSAAVAMLREEDELLKKYVKVKTKALTDKQAQRLLDKSTQKGIYK